MANNTLFGLPFDANQAAVLSKMADQWQSLWPPRSWNRYCASNEQADVWCLGNAPQASCQSGPAASPAPSQPASNSSKRNTSHRPQPGLTIPITQAYGFSQNQPPEQTRPVTPVDANRTTINEPSTIF